MTEFVNPVHPNSGFIYYPFNFKDLRNFLKLGAELQAGFNCQVCRDNFVHKLEIDAAAAVFNNQVFGLMSSPFRL